MRYLLIMFFAANLIGCSTSYQNNDVTGLNFPTVSGENLEKTLVTIPQAFSGQPALLLVGYKQDAQFDIDRWLIGLDMTQTTVAVYEIPTIAGMFPRMFKTVIDNGMRAGIPKELWQGVITVYQDGERVQAFTGNTNPNNTRVLLLDKTGKIVYFYDRGFSVNALNELRLALNKEQVK
ncbi:hypothetical protein ACMAZF_02210 [Psychrobium sp. nBUS_13]|uniref:hypothetical protein n=1 Tax=Psychrobium sp. nBUS_13 TaxID=3395319 RepID=UPI003EBC73C3